MIERTSTRPDKQDALLSGALLSTDLSNLNNFEPTMSTTTAATTSMRSWANRGEPPVIEINLSNLINYEAVNFDQPGDLVNSTETVGVQLQPRLMRRLV